MHFQKTNLSSQGKYLSIWGRYQVQDGYADFDVDVDDGNQAYFVNIRLVGWKHIFFSVLKIGRVIKKHSYVQRLVKIHFLQEKQYSVSKTSLLGHGKVSLCKNIFGKRFLHFPRKLWNPHCLLNAPAKVAGRISNWSKNSHKIFTSPTFGKIGPLAITFRIWRTCNWKLINASWALFSWFLWLKWKVKGNLELTLFAPAYLSVSRDQGGHICPRPPPLYLGFGLGFGSKSFK